MKYQLEKKVMQNAALRKAYNELAEKTFGLNFEAWYQSGYCGDTHIPYTLFDGKKAVSNVSVNLMKIAWQGNLRHYIQLGTVMTDPAYGGQGLSRYLMEEVLRDWKDRADTIFLFANQSVLEFYPRFGFERQEQYQWSMPIEAVTGNHSVDEKMEGQKIQQQKTEQGKIRKSGIEKYNIEKLDIEDPNHLNLLKKCYQKGNPFSKLRTVDGFGLLMFYCGSFLKDCIYYIPEMDAVVIAETEGETLYCLDIFSEAGKDPDRMLAAVATEEMKKIVFQFTPEFPTAEHRNYERKKIEDEDNALFVLKGKENIFAGEKLMFPEIAHT